MKSKGFTEDQKRLRRRILEICLKRSFSHLGSCLSSVDIIEAVYNVKKNNEKFVLSNGHAGIALYVVLEKNGLIKPADVERLNVHPDRNPKLGIDVSTGSLGQGLPIAVGLALADKKKNIFCLISDGECMEGSIWEALRIAYERKLSNLKIVVNANGWGAYRSISLVNLARMFRGFGYKPIIIDGHNLGEIKRCLEVKEKEKPALLFARSEVNQFPFLKGLDAHYFLLNQNDYETALRLLK